MATQPQAIQELSPEVKAQAVEAARPSATLMDRATSHRGEAGDSATSHGGNREALMHNQSAPDKTQERLSPTDSGKGQTQTQQRSMERGRGMER
jgi:hypothetical protein